MRADRRSSLIPTPAFADYTVTIKNTTGKHVHIKPGGHGCIHDPNYFDKELAVGEKIEVHAKWSNDLGCDPNEDEYFLELCRTDTSICDKLTCALGLKYVEVGPIDGIMAMVAPDIIYGGEANLCPRSPDR